jgi:hypothetical protein
MNRSGKTPDTRAEIVKKLDGLTARYVKTHDPELRGTDLQIEP